MSGEFGETRRRKTDTFIQRSEFSVSPFRSETQTVCTKITEELKCKTQGSNFYLMKATKM